MQLRIKWSVRTVALLGVLTALALALGFAESFLLPALPLGVKPGLSNIAVLLAAGVLGWPAGLAVALVKAVFAGVTRGLTALLLSGAGGLCSAALTGALLRLKTRREALKLTETGIGMLGGAAHNLAQLALAAALTHAAAVFSLLPLLLLAGTAAGAVTGTLARAVRQTLNKERVSRDEDAQGR